MFHTSTPRPESNSKATGRVPRLRYDDFLRHSNLSPIVQPSSSSNIFQPNIFRKSNTSFCRRDSVDSTLSSTPSSSSPSHSASLVALSQASSSSASSSFFFPYNADTSFCSVATSSVDDRSTVATDASPPTRWPAARTPRRRRSAQMRKASKDDTGSHLSELVIPSTCEGRTTSSQERRSSNDDSGFLEPLNVSVFTSPPISRHTLLNGRGTPLLRTPTERDVLRPRTLNTLHLSSSPSPLRRFELKKVCLTSPRLSDPRNSTDVRFTCADVRSDRPVEVHHLAGGATSSASSSSSQSRPVARCLHPSDVPRPTSPLVSGNREKLSQHLETPSKCGACDELNESFYLSEASSHHDVPMLDVEEEAEMKAIRLPLASRVPEHASGPFEQSLVASFGGPLFPEAAYEEVYFDDDATTEADDTENEESQPAPLRKERPAVLIKRTITEDDIHSASSSQDSKRPKLMTSNIDPLLCPMETRTVKEQSPTKQPVGEDSCISGKKVKKKQESSTVFRTPKKPFKPYSRRWWQVCTGSTPAQREVTAAAHAFLKLHYGAAYSLANAGGRHSPLLRTPASTAPPEPVPGAPVSHILLQDPLFYQPPPLSLLSRHPPSSIGNNSNTLIDEAV